MFYADINENALKNWNEILDYYFLKFDTTGKNIL